MKDENLYAGLSLHSAQHRNAQLLKEHGVKSVAIIGSANTAFDIIQDCHNAGLKTTTVARSPTYIHPYGYVMDPHGTRAHDLMPLEATDRLLNTHDLFAPLVAQGIMMTATSPSPKQAPLSSTAGTRPSPFSII
ncbi:hypothetical protein VM1G_11621 [Cytospora mali]|uniref:Uncharacterized protein n=1 Tax=Cytospora mali TaxID=578113 RepID=A0A194VYC7_CYTMA|nr:hypothetical protein VM1G_11621 [Valsa mali]